jgi:hypothetical protein
MRRINAWELVLTGLIGLALLTACGDSGGGSSTALQNDNSSAGAAPAAPAPTPTFGPGSFIEPTVEPSYARSCIIPCTLWVEHRTLRFYALVSASGDPGKEVVAVRDSTLTAPDNRAFDFATGVCSDPTKTCQLALNVPVYILVRDSQSTPGARELVITTAEPYAVLQNPHHD